MDEFPSFQLCAREKMKAEQGKGHFYNSVMKVVLLPARLRLLCVCVWCVCVEGESKINCSLQRIVYVYMRVKAFR